MSTILFRCPNTGYPVQGWFAHGVSRDCKDIFEGVICLACGGVHLVNPKDREGAWRGGEGKPSAHIAVCTGRTTARHGECGLDAP
jgi:hypothetical protein